MFAQSRNPNVFLGIPGPASRAYTFNPESRTSKKAKPASRKIYWGPSKQSWKSRWLSLASRIPDMLSIPNPPPVCFKILSPGLQIRQILYPEKSIEDPWKTSLNSCVLCDYSLGRLFWWKMLERNWIQFLSRFSWSKPSNKVAWRCVDFSS